MISQCKVGCDQCCSDSAKRESERRDWFWNGHSREVYWSHGLKGWIHKEEKKLNRAAFQTAMPAGRKAALWVMTWHLGKQKKVVELLQSPVQSKEEQGWVLGEPEGARCYRVSCASWGACILSYRQAGVVCVHGGVFICFFYMNASKSEICSVHNTSAEMHTSMP